MYSNHLILTWSPIKASYPNKITFIRTGGQDFNIFERLQFNPQQEVWSRFFLLTPWYQESWLSERERMTVCVFSFELVGASYRSPRKHTHTLPRLCLVGLSFPLSSPMLHGHHLLTWKHSIYELILFHFKMLSRNVHSVLFYKLLVVIRETKVLSKMIALIIDV